MNPPHLFLSFRRTSEARQEESAVQSSNSPPPTRHSRSPPADSSGQNRPFGMTKSYRLRQKPAVSSVTPHQVIRCAKPDSSLVIPTPERSEKGGIRSSPCHSDTRAKRGGRDLLFPAAPQNPLAFPPQQVYKGRQF